MPSVNGVELFRGKPYPCGAVTMVPA